MKLIEDYGSHKSPKNHILYKCSHRLNFIQYIGYFLFAVIVTTRIIQCLGSGFQHSDLNLHLPYYWEGDNPTNTKLLFHLHKLGWNPKIMELWKMISLFPFSKMVGFSASKWFHFGTMFEKKTPIYRNVNGFPSPPNRTKNKKNTQS